MLPKRPVLQIFWLYFSSLSCFCPTITVTKRDFKTTTDLNLFLLVDIMTGKRNIKFQPYNIVMHLSKIPNVLAAIINPVGRMIRAKYRNLRIKAS